MSKITTNDIINLAGIEAEIARLEAVNTELTKLAVSARKDAGVIKNALKNIGGSASELGKVQSQAKGANSSFKALQKQISANNANLKTLQSKLGGVRTALGGVASGAKKATAPTNRLATATNRVTKSTNAAASSLKRWVGGLIGYHLVERFTSSVVKMGIEMDRLRFTYETILRGQGELDRAWEFTSRLANQYGVSIIEVRDSFIKFRAAADAAGISASGTEEMFDTFTKTSAVLGLSTEKAGLALRALSQIAAKGTVQMEELRGQLGEQIPGAVALMAEGMGIGLGQFERMVANGEILSNEALPALAKQMRATFNLDLIDNIDTAQTAVGKLTTAYVEFAEALQSGEAVKIFAKGLTVLLKWLTNNGRALFNLAKAMTLALASLAVYRTAIVFSTLATGSFAGAVGASTIQLKLFTIASRTAAAASALLSAAINLNPILLGVTAIAAASYAWSEYRDEITKTAEEERKRLATSKSELSQLEKIAKVLEEEKVSRSQLLRIVSKTNSINPNILKGIDAETVSRTELTTAINKQVSALAKITGGENIAARTAEVSKRINQLESRKGKFSDNLDPFQREELSLLKKELSELNKLAQENAIAAMFEGVEDGINNTYNGLEKIRIAEEKAKKDREKALAAFLKAEQERLAAEKQRISYMEDGLQKELALLENQHETIALKWRGHHDILILERERYLKEKADLEAYYARPDLSVESIGSVGLPDSLSPSPAGPFDRTADDDKADFLDRAGQIGRDGGLKAQEDAVKALEDVEAKKRKIRKMATDFAMKQIKKLADFQLQIAEEELRRADQKVQTATAELNAQVALADAGYAANVGNAQRNLQLEKENQRKALDDKKKAQKAQLAIDAATQVSNLITATTEIWKSSAGKGPIIGTALAIAATALMWGSFAAAQIGAFKAVKKQKYGKGGLEIIGGGTHASGNDTPLGFSVNGREAYGEKGEAHMIVSAKNTRRYKNLLPEIEKGLNSGTFESMLNANISPIVNTGHGVDMSQTERHLRDIKNQGERQRFVDSDGNIVESYRNLTVRYK